MAGDDHGSEPFLVSHPIRTSLGAAIDHLHALYALVLHSGYLHLHAPASVTRGALECASTAIWLAAPPARDERIRRALCWAGKDIKDGDKAAVGAGYPVPTPVKERIEKLNAAARSRGLAPQAIKNGFSSTEAVEAAKAHLGPGTKDVLLAWRLCSGFAHGRSWSALGFADNVQTPVPGGSDRVTVESGNSYRHVLALAIAADLTVDAAVRLFDLRARGR